MSKQMEVEISTTNSAVPKAQWTPEKSGLVIKVKCEANVSETLEEASTWYGSEENLLKSIQQDQARRQANAARPLLRDSETVLDWQTVAQDAINSFQPGKRGGGRSVTVDEAELRSATNMDDLLKLLRERGVKIASATGEEENGTEGEIEDLEESGEEEDIALTA